MREQLLPASCLAPFLFQLADNITNEPSVPFGAEIIFKQLFSHKFCNFVIFYFQNTTLLCEFVDFTLRDTHYDSKMGTESATIHTTVKIMMQVGITEYGNLKIRDKMHFQDIKAEKVAFYAQRIVGWVFIEMLAVILALIYLGGSGLRTDWRKYKGQNDQIDTKYVKLVS